MVKSIGISLGVSCSTLLRPGSLSDADANLSLGSLTEMGPLLPSCTFTFRIGQVLADSCTDGVDILFAEFGLCTSESWLERFSRVDSATGKMSLMSALIVLMNDCRFWC